MKKFTLFITAVFVPYLALAQEITENKTDKSLNDLLVRIKDYLLSFVGGVAVLFIIIGGLKYISAAGNQQKIDSAKKTLTYAIIGLALVILANVILGILASASFLKIFN